MMCFVSPGKHIERFGFVKFAGVIEREHWVKIGLFQVFVPVGSYFARKVEVMVHFM